MEMTAKNARPSAVGGSNLPALYDQAADENRAAIDAMNPGSIRNRKIESNVHFVAGVLTGNTVSLSEQVGGGSYGNQLLTRG